MTEINNIFWNRIQNGGLTEFEELYHQFFRPLCMYAHQILRNKDITEELVNDIFLKLWENRKTIFISVPVKNYLYAAVHNASINKAKSLATTKANVINRVSEEHWKFIEDTYMINDFILEKIDLEHLEKKLSVIIGELPEQCREIFIRNRFEEKSIKDIAQMLDITENTVRVQIFRALEKIKEALEK